MLRFVIVPLLCALCVLPCLADNAVPLIDGYDPTSFNVPIHRGTDARSTIVAVNGQPFERAVRVAVNTKTDPVWAAQIISSAATRTVVPGDVIEGEYYLRADPVNGSTPEIVGYFRSEADGFHQLVWLGTRPTPRWTRHTFRVKADRSYEPGDLAVNLHLGQTAQVVEFAGLRVTVTPGQGSVDDAAAEPEPVDNPIDSALLQRLGADATLLIAGHRPADLAGPGPDPDASLRLIHVEGQAFTQAVRVTVGKTTDPVWDAQLTSPSTAGPVRRGDVLFGLIDVRGQSDKESGGGQYTAWLQSPGNADRGWTELRRLAGAPGPRWQRRFFATRATEDFDAGEVNLVLHLGVIPQTVDVANMLLWNLGPDADLAALPTTRLTYTGQEPDAPWRAEAQRRIDQHRKADLTVRVRDADGQPVPDARVRVTLDRLDFGLGTFIGNRRGAVYGDTPDSQRFAEHVLAYFNRVTTPCYAAEGWGWPSPESKTHQVRTLQWAVANSLPAKAHTVVWSRFDWSPREYTEARDDPARLKAEIDADIREVVGWVTEYGAESVDLVNESNQFRQFEEVIQEPGLRASWFKAAHAVSPSLRLGINEHTMLSGGGLNRAKQDGYADVIRDLIDRDTPLHFIGMQGHMGEDFTPPTVIWEVLDRFAEFGLPITITELDINTEDEQTQADYLRDFVLAVFAHPAVESVTLWGFWGGDIWIPQAELWREDWSRTPAADAWVKLVTETLHTEESLVTDRDGQASVRGFRGTYRITVEHPQGQGQSTTRLDADGTTVDITLSESRQTRIER